MSGYCLGLDLGKEQDYTAVAALQVAPGGNGGAVYQLRHLERFKLRTPYHEIVARVGALMESPQLTTRVERTPPSHWDPVAIDDWHRRPFHERKPVLVVDATGVGGPVCDMLTVAGIPYTGVLITGGEEEIPPTIHTTVEWVARSGPGGGGSKRERESPFWRVPKRDLVATVQVLLQGRRLRFAAGLPLVDVLQRELLNFQVKINPQTAHDSYGAWREGTHDDLVLAVALAAWKAEKKHGPKRRTGGMF